ncbi:hypothetical protein SDC9_148806 [bioreactor metagenome]|uniref:Uncharacterized protein n=1 Tax=bioreactor metagenome TaxID=1076179 RepID=A0A645EJH3_9ZZZZ
MEVDELTSQPPHVKEHILTSTIVHVLDEIGVSTELSSVLHVSLLDMTNKEHQNYL